MGLSFDESPTLWQFCECRTSPKLRESQICFLLLFIFINFIAVMLCDICSVTCTFAELLILIWSVHKLFMVEMLGLLAPFWYNTLSVSWNCFKPTPQWLLSRQILLEFFPAKGLNKLQDILFPSATRCTLPFLSWLPCLLSQCMMV